MLFSDLIVWYLFLGGLGGGLCLVALYVEVRARDRSQKWFSLYRMIWMPALIGSFSALSIGSVCLMKDLALPNMALLLYTKPTASPITIGTYALTGLLICLALLIFFAFRDKPPRYPVVHKVIRGFAAVLSCIVIGYTGVLLSTISAVPFWLSFFVPVLFILSSLSSGIAGVILIASFPHPVLSETGEALRSLLRIDVVVIALEVVSVLALGIHVAGNAPALASVGALVVGRLSMQFWMGFVACGLILPIAMELVLSSRLSRQPAFYLVLGCLILMGAFYLRYCIVFGGVHLSAFMLA